jgi:hypothetical protein
MAIEWSIVAGAMLVITLGFSDSTLAEVISAIVLGGVVYLAVGYLSAKLGYQRASLRQLRAQRAAAAAAGRAVPTRPAPRQRPAPTKRTGGGTSRSRKR